MSETLTVGQQLRQEREKKDITLEAVSLVTRISIEQLKALERDDFQVISAPVFVRGFLRSYAAYLGIDSKEIIARYDAQVDLFKLPPKLKEAPPSRKNTGLFKYGFLLVIIFIAVAAAYYYFQQETPPPPPASPVAVAPTVAVAPAPSPAPSPGPETPPPAAEKVVSEKPVPETPVAEKVLVPPVTSGPPPGKPPEKAASPPPVAKEAAKEGDKSKESKHLLKIATTEKSWVRIKADDQPASEALLQSKQTATWSARRKFDITIGNAGGVDLSFNGISLGRLGKSGEVINLTLPKEDRPQSQTPNPMKAPSEPGTFPKAKPIPALKSGPELKSSTEIASKQQDTGVKKELDSKESTPAKNTPSSQPNQKLPEKGEQKHVP